MDSTKIFTAKVPELESLPEVPEILFYVSALFDFRPNKFLSYGNLNALSQNGIELPKPELFIYNCLDPQLAILWEYLQAIRDGINYMENYNAIIDIILPYIDNEEVKIIPETFRDLNINENIFYPIDFGNTDTELRDQNQQNIIIGNKAYYFEVEVNYMGSIERQKILYFEHENIGVFEDIILKRFFDTKYLCATQQGIGHGCKSIIEYIYNDNAPAYCSNYGFKPDYLILNGGETTRFKDIIDTNPLVTYHTNYCNYIELRNDETLFKIDYHNDFDYNQENHEPTHYKNLLKACKDGNIDLVRNLIEEQDNSFGPIQIAAHYKHDKIVQLLVNLNYYGEPENLKSLVSIYSSHNNQTMVVFCKKAFLIRMRDYDVENMSDGEVDVLYSLEL